MALNKDRIFKAADKYIRSNKIEKAINEYETWLKENKKDWNTVRIVGDLYARIGRNDEAIKKYAQVADNYRRDGFNVRAIATHKMILRLDPASEVAMRSLAELQAEEGLLMEAKSHYQTLVELYNKQGHKRLASEVFKKLAEIDPQDVKIRYKYAEFLNKQGKADEAAREYVGIADQFIGQGLVDEAIKILEQGRPLDTTEPTLKIKLAQALSLHGDHPQAVKMLEEVRRSHPADTGVLGRLGEAYLASGNTAEAEGAFQQLIDADPTNPDNVLRLAGLRIAQSKFDAALEQLTPLDDQKVGANEGPQASELLNKVLAKDPYHIKTLLKLAEVHTILKQESGRIAAYDSLCEAYNRAGDFEKAVQVAEQLVELDPESSQHKDRLKFLKSKLAAPAPQQAQAATHSAAPPPQVQADHDLPELEEIGEVDLGDAVSASFENELSLDEVGQPAAALAASVDLGDVVELTQEDVENVKEKLTEAEVFVRYGLVDKAIAQLLDVLESFRFQTESREKLVEIYKDQGMNREAGEQLIHLAQVYDKLGDAAKANAAREEGAALNLALAAQAATAELAAQEEIELTLEQGTQSELGDIGIEVDAPLGDDFALPAEEVEEDFELPVELEVAPPSEVSEEVPFEVDLGEEAEMELGVEAGFEEAPAQDEEIPVSLDEALPDFTEITTSSEPEHSASIDSVDEEIDIDLEASAEDIAFSVDSDVAPEEAEQEVLLPPIEETGDVEVSLPSEDESDVGLPAEAAVDEEFSVEIGDGEEFSADLSDDADEGALLSQSLDQVSNESSSADIEIDIPAVEDVELPDEEPVFDPAPEPVYVPEPPPAPDPEPVASAAVVPARAPVPAAPGPPASPLAAELSEVDEYIALGLYEDARDTLRDLLKKNPGDADVVAKLEELGFSAAQEEVEQPTGLASGRVPEPPVAFKPPPGAEARASAPIFEPAPEPEEEPIGIESLVDSPQPVAQAFGTVASSENEFIDLASELSDGIFGTHSAVEEEAEVEGPLTDPGLEQIFREFRKGVEKQLGTEDYDTRYNLGIAYKEMGLLDEAIAEFQLAAKDEVRGLECCSMLGLCFIEKGMPDIAIKWFSKGLDIPGRRDEEYHGLRYDLAQAYEAANQRDRALQLYMEVYRENARFRDVGERVRELQAALNAK